MDTQKTALNRLNLVKGHVEGKQTAWVMKNIQPLEFFPKGSLKGKTLFISGASRGIGLAIGLRAAKDGANVAIAAKTTDPHPKLPGTIYTAAEEIEKAGGKSLAIKCDIRDEQSVQDAIEQTVEKFGGLDILINNASAISLTSTELTDMKRYDLMHSINTRGTYVCSKYAYPYLKNSENPHILNISPPLDLFSQGTNWFAPHVGYTMAKYGMTLCAYGMSGEFKEEGIACNTLWPRTAIATAAVQNLLGGDSTMKVSRSPDIMADAAYVILTSDSRKTTGQFFMDDEVLISVGETDVEKYNMVKGTRNEELAADYFS